LQRFVGLQDALDVAGDFVMFLTDNARIEDAAGRIQRIDCRIDAEFSNLARQHRRRIEMGERCGGCRGGQIIGRNVDGLH